MKLRCVDVPADKAKMLYALVFVLAALSCTAQSKRAPGDTIKVKTFDFVRGGGTFYKIKDTVGFVNFIRYNDGTWQEVRYPKKRVPVTAFHYYPNGSLLSSMAYDKHGRKKQFLEYYIHGAIYRNEPYVKGRKQGELRYFHEDGTLMARLLYAKGKCIKILEMKRANGTVEELSGLEMKNKYILQHEQWGLFKLTGFNGAKFDSRKINLIK